MKRSLAILSLWWLTALPLPTALAAPVPEEQRIPVDLRRTTLVVRDIERSLPLYRDTLGMRVIYDETLGGTPATIRLVLLRANDNFIGVLGLMQRLNLTEAPPPPQFRRAAPGEIILVFNVQDLETRFEHLRSTPGVRIAETPRRIDYPGPNGTSIPVLFSAVWDADGHFVELNRLLGTPAGVTRPASALSSESP
ncbi:MAG: VOC family protein [Steroidobacteraceae bacterium]